MQVKLRVLFILVAVVAFISAWSAQRVKPLPFSAMIQIADRIPGNGSTGSRSVEFEESFYALLLKKLTAEHPKTLNGMSDPKAELRDVIRCEQMPQMLDKDSVPLYTVKVWGNAYSGRKRLEQMMKTAVEVLEIQSTDQSSAFVPRILTLSSP